MNNPHIHSLLSTGNAFTTAQAVAAGISRQTLCDYLQAGKLIRMGRGIYLPAHESKSESPEIEVLQQKGCDFVLCLLSALRFYNIGTQHSHAIWISVKKARHIPSVNFPLECLRLEEHLYSALFTIQTINNLPIKVYTPARTVADCFRFRNRIGLDVAMEALRDGWHKKLFTVDEILEAAKICRIANTLTPYLEMLVG